VSIRFKQLLSTSPTQWQQDDLCLLTSDQLGSLCKLMGISSSGNKQSKILRLLDAAELRGLLSEVQQPEELTRIYKLHELRGLARRAKSYAWGNKYAVAMSLINWRNECRRTGQQFLDEAKRAAKIEAETKPSQLRIKINNPATQPTVPREKSRLASYPEAVNPSLDTTTAVAEQLDLFDMG
jgi:hypothetical protein